MTDILYEAIIGNIIGDEPSQATLRLEGEARSVYTPTSTHQNSCNMDIKDDVCQIFQNDNDITIYGDVLELGEDNPFDEECPDRYSEAEFGQYLCDQYEENGGDVFYYKCKDGSILVGLMV